VDAPQFDASLYSQTSLILMGILIMILNPLDGGVVEELYYRGYLLEHPCAYAGKFDKRSHDWVYAFWPGD